MPFAASLEFTGREWSVLYQDRPWSLNAERSWHHQQRARTVRIWREAFRALALEAKVPRLQSCTVTVQPYGIRQDLGNCYPAAKAAIDGLVDARVIANDTPEYLLGLMFLTGQPGTPALELVVHELVPHRLAV